MVSNVLPKSCETFSIIDGVWVTHQRFALPLVAALRHALIEVASLRQANAGQRNKMELMYQYLTGPQFRLRIEAIVDKFTDMQADLDRERKVITRLWANVNNSSAPSSPPAPASTAISRASQETLCRK